MASTRGTDTLTPEQRAIARSLRQAARIIGHAALPAEYRAPAFVVLAPIIVARDTTRGPQDLVPGGRCPKEPRRSW